MTAKYAFIESEEGCYPIILMCRWARVSRSGYYDWCSRGQSATAARREILQAEIRFAFTHSDGTYGYRRIHAQLARVARPPVSPASITVTSAPPFAR